MKAAATVLLMAVLGMQAAAEDRAKPALQEITLCMDGVDDFRIVTQSQMIASQMFGAAGVKIGWRRGRQGCSPQSILITLGASTPPELLPGAMAYALPFEGIHIRLFYDRIALAPPPLIPRLLAHVLVHEVTHILQATARHSHEGIMKARWDQHDYNSMFRKTMRFTDEDIQLIHDGVQARTTRLLAVRSVR